MVSVASGGLHICVSSTSNQKTDVSWPQQPLSEEVQKFNMIFHDSTQNNFFSNIKNKAAFKCLDDSKVLSGDFSGLKTSAASMTSAASTASMASVASTALFHQRTFWSWWLDHPWIQNDQNCSLFVELIIKNPFFNDIWYLCCQRLLRPADITFSRTGWWNSNVHTSWTH